MKVIELPVLSKSTQEDGILLRLVECKTAQGDPIKHTEQLHECVRTLFGLLADYADVEFVTAIIREVVVRANAETDLADLLKYWRLPSGSNLVAAAPEYVPPKLKVRDKTHPLYGHTGELLFAEGETCYLWLGGNITAFHLDQLKPVR